MESRPLAVTDLSREAVEREVDIILRATSYLLDIYRRVRHPRAM